MLRCPYCGWPDDEPVTTVSVHKSPSGTTTWTRCICGSLQTRVTRGKYAVIAARSRPAEPTPTA